MKHKVVVGFRMVPGQPHVLVHIEGLDVLEGDFAGFVILHKLGIHFQRGASFSQKKRGQIS